MAKCLTINLTEPVGSLIKEEDEEAQTAGVGQWKQNGVLCKRKSFCAFNAQSRLRRTGLIVQFGPLLRGHVRACAIWAKIPVDKTTAADATVTRVRSRTIASIMVNFDSQPLWQTPLADRTNVIVVLDQQFGLLFFCSLTHCSDQFFGQSVHSGLAGLP